MIIQTNNTKMHLKTRNGEVKIKKHIPYINCIYPFQTKEVKKAKRTLRQMLVKQRKNTNNYWLLWNTRRYKREQRTCLFKYRINEKGLMK